MTEDLRGNKIIGGYYLFEEIKKTLFRWVLSVVCCLGVAGEVMAQHWDPPQIIGTMVGSAAQYPNQANLQIYGSDLGWSFEHAGELQILFGDTWPYDDFLCDPPPENDDSQALLEHP
ncbi:MAG: hypothetical protein R3351_02890, partial [Nitrospirales bacterium]|nr:hypothetical protein [Nitrospirales bacterium]